MLRAGCGNEEEEEEAPEDVPLQCSRQEAVRWKRAQVAELHRCAGRGIQLALDAAVNCSPFQGEDGEEEEEEGEGGGLHQAEGAATDSQVEASILFSTASLFPPPSHRLHKNWSVFQSLT